MRKTNCLWWTFSNDHMKKSFLDKKSDQIIGNMYYQSSVTHAASAYQVSFHVVAMDSSKGWYW